MKKIVIIINGKGASGKDTLCAFARARYRCKNISSITPIKKIAAQAGWNGEKDKKSRRFLADLKQLFIEYNDLPLQYLLQEYSDFVQDLEEEILFVHIREPKEIDKFKKQVTLKCITLLIRGKTNGETFGNDSDDLVEQYPYDYIYENVLPLWEVERDFTNYLGNILQ